MRQLILMLACVGFVGCDVVDFGPTDRYQSDFHYSYPLKPGGRLELENFNGAVEIIGWDQNECLITGTKSASTPEMRDRIKVEVQQTSGGIYVRSVRPPGDFQGSMGVHYAIRVPRKTELNRIITTNGGLRVEEIEAPVEVKTTNGAVHVEHVTGMLKAQTSNGTLTALNIAGDLLVHTSNGAIRADQISGAVEATTSNGSITAHFDDRAAPSSTLSKFETNNGHIEITLPSSPKSEIRAQTSNSSITVRLPADTSAKIRMTTSHGQVHSDFAGQSSGEDRHGHHQTMEQTIGSGGPLIDLHTTNGSIRVSKL